MEMPPLQEEIRINRRHSATATTLAAIWTAVVFSSDLAAVVLRRAAVRREARGRRPRSRAFSGRGKWT